MLFFIGTAGSAGAEERIGVVLLHGKLGSALGSPAAVGKMRIGSALIAALRRAGHLVATPEMCWSGARGFDRTYTDCFGDIDDAIADLRSKGATAIVLGGMSLGGNAAIGYGAGHAGLLGVVAMAPADDPASKAKRPEIASVIARAQELVQQARGDEPTSFEDINTGPRGIYTKRIITTPRIYLSFYGPDSPASIPANTARLSAPLLWVAGSEDPTQRRGPSFAFDKARPQPLNRYVTVTANHLETPDAGRDAILAWLAELTGRQTNDSRH
jgi:pimeloyl-ACP methyl ester carboxylesterase